MKSNPATSEVGNKATPFLKWVGGKRSKKHKDRSY
jgi:hypothetical protein